MKKPLVLILGCLFAMATWGQDKFTVPDFCKPLDQMLDKYQVTCDELSEFYEIYARQMANLTGSTFLVEDTGTVIKIFISKK